MDAVGANAEGVAVVVGLCRGSGVAADADTVLGGGTIEKAL